MNDIIQEVLEQKVIHDKTCCVLPDKYVLAFTECAYIFSQQFDIPFSDAAYKIGRVVDGPNIVNRLQVLKAACHRLKGEKIT